MSFSSVLVATDFSRASVAGLGRVRSLARPLRRLRLLHVCRPVDDLDGPMGSFPFYSNQELQAPAELARLVSDLRSVGFPHVDSEVVEGEPAAGILAACARFRADVVVVGARSGSILGRVDLGSVCEEVVRRSPIPVLVARAQAEGTTVERVLVAVDHDQPSRAAALTGRDLARRFGVKLVAIHVIAAREGGAPSPIVEGALGARMELHVVAGRPAIEILGHARPSDLVVCGPHGRDPLDPLVSGGVVSALLRGAPCPVLVVSGAPPP